METNNQQPPKGKKSKEDPKDKLKQHQERQNRPAAAEDVSDAHPSGPSKDPSHEDANANWRRPITNQDEQEKITNQDDTDSVQADK